MRKLIIVLCITAITQGAPAAGLNSLILEQIQKMPTGGKYSVSHFAKIKLESAAHFESGKFFVIPTASTCASGRVTFLTATAKKKFRAPRLRTRFSRD